MQNFRKELQFFRVALDIFVLISCYFLAIYLIPGKTFYLYKVSGYSLLILLIVVWGFFGNINLLYDEYRSRNFSFELIAILKTVFTQVIASIIVIFSLQSFIYPRSFVLVYGISLTSILIIERYFLRKIFHSIRKRGHNLRNLLIVGAGELGMNFYNSIVQNEYFGYKMVGFLDDEKKTYLNGEYLGTVDNIDAILKKNTIDDVIIALPNYACEKVENLIKTCENYTIRVKILPDYFKFSAGKFEISMFGKFPIVSIRDEKINHIQWRLLKRAMDTIISSILFISVLWWSFIIIGITIKLTSKGPIFFKQIRWGRNNRRIVCYKFRSMEITSRDVDKKGKYVQAVKDDPRVTSIGKFLRKTNFDELPQFINVLKGEMSLVGPRPHPLPLNAESREEVRGYMQRTLVKPGITGWAQVNGHRGATPTIKHMQNRIDHDLWYIENWTILLDIQILFMTLWQMIKGDPNAY